MPSANDFSTLSLGRHRSVISQSNEDENDGTATTATTAVSVNNPDVNISGVDLRIYPDFVTPAETEELLQEVYYGSESKDFVWEGFDQRRRVQQWHNQDGEDLPPTLLRLAERIQKMLMLKDDHDLQQQRSNNGVSFPLISFQEYRQNQMLRHLNPNNKTNVTAFETPDVCRSCSNKCTSNDDDKTLLECNGNEENGFYCDSSNCSCLVAIVPLTASLIENANRPKERSINCWDLHEPKGRHSTSWVLPQSSLIVKRRSFLYNWRHRIVQILDDNNHIGNNNKEAEASYEEKDTAVLLKFYHVPKEVLKSSKEVPSPEFGYVPTLETQAEELRRRSMPLPPMEDLLTILVTTSPIRSNPSTELLERVFDTFINGGHTFAYRCRKVVVCDGARQRSESTTQKYNNDKQAMRNGLVTSEQNDNYCLFKQNLRRLCEAASQNGDDDNDDPPSPFVNTTVHELESRQGYGFAVRHALHECITTPYVIVIQHDRTIMRPTPIQETLNAMWNHTNIKYVGMSMRSNLMYSDIFYGQYGKAYTDDYKASVLRPLELNVDAQKFGPDSESTVQMVNQVKGKVRDNIVSLADNYRKGQQYAEFKEWRETTTSTLPKHHQMTLTPTFFWYDNVHICETQHYRDFIFDPRYKMVVRGGFVEDKLSPVIKKTVERLGLKDGHSRFGCYLLDDHSGFFFTGHLDGGSFLDASTKETMLLTKRESATNQENQQRKV